jgi:GMP synthase-like glutamine amidotransferase
MKIVALYHVEFENLGYIRDWIDKKGHELVEIHLDRQQALPDTGSFDMLIVMGGPMRTSDENKYSWLGSEKDLIVRSFKEKKTVLGICLGAQLIACALGARVTKNRHKEIGWFPVTVYRNAFDPAQSSLLPKEMNVFHWHGDTFDLPRGATLLASSRATLNQGFMIGNTIMALQFHLEMKSENIIKLCTVCSEDLTPGQFIQSLEKIEQSDEFIQPANHFMEVLLDYLENHILQKNIER